MAYICPFLLKIWKFLKIHHAILGQIYYFPSAQWDRFIFNMKNNHPWIVGWSTPLLWQDNISVWLNILLYALTYKTQSSLSLQIFLDFPFHICPSPKLSVSKHPVLLEDPHLAVKSKVFQCENILVLEDFSLPQLIFLKLVHPWIITKDHLMGFLKSQKLLINHQEARSNHASHNLSHLDITEVSVDSE